MTANVMMAKKRDRTRDKLLIAVQELLLEKPVANLSIKDIAHQAEMVHGSFYNYFESVHEVIQGVAELFLRTHACLADKITQGIDDKALVFALKTRQTLLLISQEPKYGHLLFDAGLPVDQFVMGLRLGLRIDIEQGIKQGRFVCADLELTLSLLAGGILGLALDLHRHILPVERIEAATAKLLEQLGVDNKEAQQLAHYPTQFITPITLPLSNAKLTEFIRGC